MVEGEQQGPVLVGTLFMVAEEYLPPTSAPGTWALMSPAQGRPGCRSWRSSRRRTGKPEKGEDAQNREPLQDMGWTRRTWPPCVKVNAARLAISAPLRRSWRRLAAMAELGVTGSAGPQSPRRKPGRWRRIPARSGCGQLQIPRGTPRATGTYLSESEEMARPSTRANTAPEPSLEHDAEALERTARARTAPVARHTEQTRDSMGDTPMAEESEAPGTVGCAGSGGKHVECHCEHVSFLIGKYPKTGMEAIVQHLDRLDNAKDGLEEDVAGILDDQSAAERDMAELRAEEDRYRENLELALQKQQRVVDSLLHLLEDMSGRLKRLEESQPLALGPELPAKPAAAELVERVKTLRSAMEKPIGGPAEAPYAPPRVDPGALPFVPLFSDSIMLGEQTAPAGSMRECHATTDPRSLTVQMSHAAQDPPTTTTAHAVYAEEEIQSKTMQGRIMGSADGHG